MKRIYKREFFNYYFYSTFIESAKNKSSSSLPTEFCTITNLQGIRYTSDDLLDRVKLSPSSNSSSSTMLNFDSEKKASSLSSSVISIPNEKKRCSSLIQSSDLVSSLQQKFKSMSTSRVAKKNAFKERFLRRINSIFMEKHRNLNENNKVMF
jgi:hypothetical protein